MKIAECITDFRDSFLTFAKALKHVLADHKHLWIEARSFRSAPAPFTPKGRRLSSEVDGLYPGSPSKMPSQPRSAKDSKLQACFYLSCRCFKK